MELTGEPPLLTDLTTVAVAEPGLQPGRTVRATLKAARTHAHPA